SSDAFVSSQRSMSHSWFNSSIWRDNTASEAPAARITRRSASRSIPSFTRGAVRARTRSLFVVIIDLKQDSPQRIDPRVKPRIRLDSAIPDEHADRITDNKVYSSLQTLGGSARRYARLYQRFFFPFSHFLTRRAATCGPLRAIGLNFFPRI